MCGITGVLSLRGDPVSSVQLRSMGDAIAHRGPDSEGQYVDGNCGLAHRRLAILDLSPAGHQPMATRDGRHVMVFNGEIFNFQELRIELESLGCEFRSRTDSEVVLHAFAYWGESMLSRLNGQFAVAIWERDSRSLFVARDRYGIKPLYYCFEEGSFVFGSEIKAILRYLKNVPKPDRRGLVEYLTFQNFFTDRTLFENIRLLPAGCWARLRTGDHGELKSTQYWDFHFREPEAARDEREYREELDRLLGQAVSRQLASDVEVGSYLSGGMDSGTITALAAKQLPYIRSFTCGFDLHSVSGIELGFDEREKAEHMSYLFRTEHYEMVLKAGDMERILPRLAWHIEEPRVGQSYPNYYVAQLASKFCKVVLSGVGGDELFAGYPWRYYRTVVNDDFDHYIGKYYQFWQRLIPTEVMPEMFSPIWSDAAEVSTRDIFRRVFLDHAPNLTRPEDYINHSLYFEAKTFLHGLLVIEDKISMAHSLETRVPFLDNDLVDFAQTVPAHMKLGNLGDVVRMNENEAGPKTAKYFGKTKDGKLILRQVMGNYVPSSVSEGVKQGFSSPDASWFRGDSIEYVQRKLMGSEARIFEYLDRKSVHRLIQDHIDGRENRRLLVWSLLSLEHWLELLHNGWLYPAVQSGH